MPFSHEPDFKALKRGGEDVWADAQALLDTGVILETAPTYKASDGTLSYAILPLSLFDRYKEKLQEKNGLRKWLVSHHPPPATPSIIIL